MKDEHESFSLFETETCVQVAIQEKGATVNESYFKISKALLGVAARK